MTVLPVTELLNVTGGSIALGNALDMTFDIPWLPRQISQETGIGSAVNDIEASGCPDRDFQPTRSLLQKTASSYTQTVRQVEQKKTDSLLTKQLKHKPEIRE